MLRALFTAATGANSQQLNIDTISNNVANVNTTSYKKVRMEFQDLLSQTLRPAGATGQQGTTVPEAIQVGLGVRPSATHQSFLPGSQIQTGNPLDIAIDGDGFLKVQLDDGSFAYTRDGSFKVDANGQLVTSNGYIVQPAITIPTDAVDVVIGKNGTVSVRTSGTTTLSDVGQLTLARFANPAGLDRIGSNLYRQTSATGDPSEGVAGAGDLAATQLNAGFLETSNVQIVEELINLITAQRAFEANSKVIKASDEMLRTATNIV